MYASYRSRNELISLSSLFESNTSLLFADSILQYPPACVSSGLGEPAHPVHFAHLPYQIILPVMEHVYSAIADAVGTVGKNQLYDTESVDGKGVSYGEEISCASPRLPLREQEEATLPGSLPAPRRGVN